MRYFLPFFAVLFSLTSCKRQNITYRAVHKKTAKHAMVVSAHPLASKVGLTVLQNGGNAVDAWVATHLALAVVYPRAGNIGGGGFAVIRLADGKYISVDFRETAPAGAHRNIYLDSTGQVIPGLSLEGGLAVGVPGSVAGLYETWKKYGRIRRWETLVKPAIDLAENGFPVSGAEAKRLNKYRDLFIKYNPHNKVFIRKEWKKGDILKQPALAKTLEKIAREGSRGFYEGEVARAMVKKIRSAGGIMSLEDLKNYRVKFREPIRIKYKDYTIYSMPPPSSGGVALGQLLEITRDYPLKKWGFHSYKTVHLMVEAEKRVFADRARYLGDPDFYPVPVDKLLDTAYLKKRMEDFDMYKATPADSIFPGDFHWTKESFETTHISIVDENRMAVSCTTTLNSNYGSKVIVDGYGFFLNNEMDDFSAKPGVPNQFGLIGGEANAIEPGKRMLSSMTPTIVEKKDSLFMVLGTPGGSTIITSVYQVFLNMVEFDMDLYTAVQAKRFHHQFLPDYIMYEPRCFPPAVADSLKKAGHALKRVSKLGIVKAIMVKDGVLFGSGDERNPDDDVEGY